MPPGAELALDAVAVGQGGGEPLGRGGHRFPPAADAGSQLRPPSHRHVHPSAWLRPRAT